MSEQENVRIVKEAYSSFKNGHIEGVLQALANDVEWITPGPPELIPLAGKRRGLREVAQFFSALEEQEDIELFDIQDYIAQGDKVVAFIKYRGLVKSTGLKAEADLVHVFTFEQGKVKRFREYFDTASVLEAYHPPHVAKARSSR